MNPQPQLPAVANRPPAPLSRVAPPTLRTRVIDKVDPVGAVWGNLNTTQRVMLAIHGVILLGVSYHGYKRNTNSVPWGMAWAVGGLVCPTVTAGFALTQGYASRKGS